MTDEEIQHISNILNKYNADTWEIESSLVAKVFYAIRHPKSDGPNEQPYNSYILDFCNKELAEVLCRYHEVLCHVQDLEERLNETESKLQDLRFDYTELELQLSDAKQERDFRD